MELELSKGFGKQLAIIVFLQLFLLGACSKPPSQTTQSALNILAPIDQAWYAELSSVEKFRMYNRLLGVLYKGESTSIFFKTNGSPQTLTPQYQENHIRLVQTRLSTASVYMAQQINDAKQRFFTDNQGQVRYAPLEAPLAYMYSMDLSKEYFDYWIAYQLVNSIMFSPALELASVDMTDVEKVYSRLVQAIATDQSIKEIVYDHMITQENWRRFRSPEDNVREMMEIFLHHFVDEDVVDAAFICRNWYLTEAEQNYQLSKNLEFSNQVLQMFGRSDIQTCENLYRAMVEYQSFLPSVYWHIVTGLMPTISDDKKKQIVAELASQSFSSFREVYTALIFSKSFLLENSYVKRFEENLFSVAARIEWSPNGIFFNYLTRTNLDATQDARNLYQMQQMPMYYKLGRNDNYSNDSASFAFMSSGLRYYLFHNVASQMGGSQTAWSPEFVNKADVKSLSDDDFIHYVFLNTLLRTAGQDELTELKKTIVDARINGYEQLKAKLLFDYVSSLPEFFAVAEVKHATP
ncbi:MAG: hypothetical protein OEZ58_12825 [Gammaproteobacteria bacterium]|nr:hypothetical protein [Gammaproteobacteria bacterium]MDH5729871.1 hypothetical protein [Gammaproteobacteria bacterium]